MEAMKAQTDDKDKLLEEATKGAADVPLTVMKKSLEVLKLAKPVAEKGNVNSVSDAGVAGLMGLAAMEGAAYNVRINCQGLDDKSFVDKMLSDAKALLEEGRTVAEDIRKIVDSKI
jgi:glutamate formiminotransferase/formiminotetrahydrofolate cyclodeaminase